MNPIWLLKNIRTSWRYRGDLSSFVKRLLWTYSHSVLGRWCPSEMNIRFCYDEPIGKIRLRVRANGGSDGFIHGEVFEHHYYRLGLPFQPATILDLGANAGYTAVYFSRTYPSAKIMAVEPHRRKCPPAEVESQGKRFRGPNCRGRGRHPRRPSHHGAKSHGLRA